MQNSEIFNSLNTFHLLEVISFDGLGCDFSTAFKGIFLVNLHQFSYKNSERDIYDPELIVLA